ncbi:MAG: hypothetical protein NW241_06425 [Bacteroidia bacterium]|nr:hypothetical protein [Bacteroidia bacterium]
MKLNEIHQHLTELRAAMSRATDLAGKLHQLLPELEEPAISAQCNVIRAFLEQASRQEEMITRMVSDKSQRV